MKKTLKIFTVLLLIALACSGCSGKSSDVSLSAADAAKKLYDEVTFVDTLVPAPEAVAKEWYGLDDDTVSEFAVYMSASQGKAEEIAVLKTSDLDAAKAIAEKRVKDLEFRFKDYVPDEMAKLSDPVIVAKGSTVVMVIADDSAEARKAVDALFDK